MATLVYDEYVEKQIREQREKCDAFKWDEVWDGIYVVLPNGETDADKVDPTQSGFEASRIIASSSWRCRP